MDFILNGQPFSLTADDVRRRMRGVPAGRVYEHALEVNGELYPIKQVLAVATRCHTSEFTSQRAQDILRRLGFRERRRFATTEPPETTTSTSPSGDSQQPWILQLRTQAGGYQEFELSAHQDHEALADQIEQHVGHDLTTSIWAQQSDAVAGESNFPIAWRNVAAATVYQRG